MREELHVFADSSTLVEAAARRWCEIAATAMDARGNFYVALSGGSTPRGLYQRLAHADLAGQVAWERVHVYFGDERAVGPEHVDSNYKMACEALLSHVPVPPAQIHRLTGEREPLGASADDYASLLAAELPRSERGVPQFDLVLLGLGSDGHTASLFPGTPVLHERERYVAEVYVEKLNSWRLTVTLPVINAARQIMVLVAGATKAGIVQELFSPNARGTYPVQLIEPLGDMHWYLDAAAAAQLEGR